MKPYEIYNLWVLFDKAMSDPAFNNQARMALGREMIQSLPPEMLCSSSNASLTVVTQAMEDRLNGITNTTKEPGKAPLRAGEPTLAPPDNEEGRTSGNGLLMESVATRPKSKGKAHGNRSVLSTGKPE